MTNDLQRFASLVETSAPSELFAALQDMVQSEVGAIIFSCSTFDLKAGQSRRIHTN